MSTNQTTPTSSSVSEFINSIEPDQKQEDCRKLVQLMSEITSQPATMWGNSIVGFDSYHYKYDSGREGDFFIVGFSPRKSNISVYLMPGLEKYSDYLTGLGKYNVGKSCLYMKKLEDVDLGQLKSLIEASWTYMKKHY